MDDTALLTVRQLSLRTPQRCLVDALDLTVRRGERWVVLGPNGAGKSTLLAAIAGARKVDGGEILIGQTPVQERRADELARDRALLTDRWTDPFASSVLDTVLTARFVFRDEDRGEAVARRWLERLDCAPLAERDVRLLSRGERQRVAIATALAQDTPLVLLDEPTAHQDPRHQAMVVRELAALPERGLVVTLHDLNAAARLATHALLLWGDGRSLSGLAGDVLTPSTLTDLFATPVSRVAVDGETVYHVHGDAVSAKHSVHG
ncbi:MAG TPA: ABC transporter ATP-binding protein [Burkholderiaceae bacterium]|jgi:iron complex transport system ATP-binding protein|nr:ABC transporter ATP-binding protein [Burkholderiaceae bacterium]